jgi:hypothetical protein
MTGAERPTGWEECMTEAEWLDCSDPDQMAAYLEDTASPRKLRLLCCACARHVWDLLETDALRQAVELFERFADGAASEEAVRAATGTTHPLMNYLDEMFARLPRERTWAAAYAVNFAMGNVPGYRYRKALEFFIFAAGSTDEARAIQVNLIREVVGNPFRPSALPCAYRSWEEGIIVNLATAIYEERSLPAGTLDQERLRILADALEEAGCTDDTLLTHLRSPGPHVRGCWAVDLILDNS